MLLRGVRPIEDRLPLSPADRLQYFIDAFVEKPYHAIKNKNILYIHTPFCESKCRYCVCHSSECKSSSDLQEFVDVILPNQVELFKEVFKNIKFDQVFLVAEPRLFFHLNSWTLSLALYQTFVAFLLSALNAHLFLSLKNIWPYLRNTTLVTSPLACNP